MLNASLASGAGMGRWSFLRHLVIMLGLCAYAIIILVSSPAHAQSFVPEPEIVPDEQGVNVVSGSIYSEFTLKLGDHHLTLLKKSITSWGNDFSLNLSLGGYYEYGSAVIGDSSIGISFKNHTFSYPYFQSSGQESYTGPFTPDISDGSTLVGNFQTKSLSYTMRDGAVVSTATGYYTINKPNGEYITVTSVPDSADATKFITTIDSNLGYEFRIVYQSSSGQVITAVNRSINYCSPTSSACTGSTISWPSLSLTSSIGYTALQNGSVETVVDPAGVTTTFSYALTSSTTTVTKSINGIPSLTYTINSADTLQRVTSVSKGSSTWYYNYAPLTESNLSSGRPIIYLQTTVTDPLSNTKIYNAQMTDGQVLSYQDELGRVYRQIYDQGGRLQYVVLPEGIIGANGVPTSGYTQYTYDARGNVTQVTKVPKAGSTLSPIVETAGFSATCSNPKTCNQPSWTRDALGNETDFTYDANSGGVLSEMDPPPSQGGPRPVKLRSYTSIAGWFMNASNVLVQSPNPVWLIASETLCQTVAGGMTPVCDGSAPQRVTTYQYGASGTAQALLVEGVAVSSGGVTLRTCYTYDVYGRKISETSPNANLGACP